MPEIIGCLFEILNQTRHLVFFGSPKLAIE
jgi:hypothetical protein